jgi:hypothetical protein
MPHITVPEIPVRTTILSDVHSHGLAIGSGPLLDTALTALRGEADRMAREAAARFGGSEFSGRPDGEWRFEVIDLRLQPGPDGDGGTGWVAYGTLISEGAEPWSGAFWDQKR